MRYVRAGVFSLFVFGLAGWLYVSANAVMHPERLNLRLTHFSDWPHQNTFGIICFIISFVALFVYMSLQERQTGYANYYSHRRQTQGLWHRILGRNSPQASFALAALTILMATMLFPTSANRPVYEAVVSGTVPVVTKPLAATATPPPPSPTPAPVPAAAAVVAPVDGHQFGFSAGDLVDLSPAELDARLADFATLGMTWVRVDIPWSVVQAAGPTSYDWAMYDRVVDAINARKLKTLLIIDYTPTWAGAPGCQGSEYCAPADPNQFAQYAGAVVRRYLPKGVNHWEVWNEPNHIGFWDPAPDPVAYMRLLKATVASIRKESPNAYIISGGLSPAYTEGGDIAPAQFMTSLYQNGFKDTVNAVAFHPYTFPATPSWHEDWNGWIQMQQVRNVMVANGEAAKPVWLTEYGAPTGGPGAIASAQNPNFAAIPDHVTEDFQASLAQQAVQTYRTHTWVGPMFWYGYRDKGTAPDTNENFFGLIRPDNSKKAAYTTLQKAIKGQ
jgi:hypothetical protein